VSNKKVASKKDVSENLVELPPAEPVNHLVQAQARIDELRAMSQMIPNFTIPTTANATQRLTSVASLPPEFIDVTAMAVSNSAVLVRGGAADPSAIRDWMAYAEAYGHVADEHDAQSAFIRHSITAAKNRAGAEALTTYALARRLAKRPENAELAPHVANMRRALGNRYKRKPKPATPAPVKSEPDKK